VALRHLGRPAAAAGVGRLHAGLGLVRSLAQALRLWAWGGVACDLVVVNTEPASYLMALQREIQRCATATTPTMRRVRPGQRRAPAGTCCAPTSCRPTSWSTLKAWRGCACMADGRPLAHHVQEWPRPCTRALGARRHLHHARCRVAVRVGARWRCRRPPGRFDADPASSVRGRCAQRARRGPGSMCWPTPISAAQVSEAGGGYTWAVNSRLNQLTAWSNDPVADPPAEWFLLQDLRTRRPGAWPSAWGDARAALPRDARPGLHRITHRRGDLEVSATWCVDPPAPSSRCSCGCQPGDRARSTCGWSAWSNG
jgi:cyclic beta-1,2-glucan synthetase